MSWAPTLQGARDRHTRFQPSGGQPPVQTVEADLHSLAGGAGVVLAIMVSTD